MNTLIEPHGGILNPVMLQGAELQEEQERARHLSQVFMNSKEVSDLIMLAMGAFSPLRGFMVRDHYLRCVREMKTPDGVVWPIPITLSVARETAHALQEGMDVALASENTRAIMGILTIEDMYEYDQEYEAREVFRTEDETHPGVQRIKKQGEVYIGGTVKALSLGAYPEQFTEFAGPLETRKIFTERGWSRVTAFQTRNPMHRSHEYLVKIALEVSDGVFIHPIVGRLKQGDIPADVRLQCYNAILSKYYPTDRIVLKVYPMEMRYGGPREAVLHAIIRQNFGCSHIIIGRDHAGVGGYYGPFEAQDIFDTIDPNALKIHPLKLDWTFWCYKCGEMASLKTCPHSQDDRLFISGTELRKMLSQGEKPPAEFSRPEVIDILTQYYAPKVSERSEV